MMMRKLLTVWIVLAAIVGVSAPLSAQLGMTGVGGGGFGPGGGGGFTGPLDVNSGAGAYYSLRCPTSAYTGNLVEVWDTATGSTTQTILGCNSGGTVVVKSGSALATTCGSGCRVKTWFDVSGSNACVGGVACDVTQATNANRPTFQTSGCTGIGSTNTWCVVGDSTRSTLLRTANKYVGGAQPVTMTMVARLTGATNNSIALVGDICCGNGLGVYIDAVGPNIRLEFGNGVLLAGYSTTQPYSIQAAFNGASSTGNVNGATVSGIAGTADGDDNGFITILADAVGGSLCNCSLQEFGVYQSLWNSTQQSNMVSNQRSGTFGWGF